MSSVWERLPTWLEREPRHRTCPYPLEVGGSVWFKSRRRKKEASDSQLRHFPLSTRNVHAKRPTFPIHISGHWTSLFLSSGLLSLSFSLPLLPLSSSLPHSSLSDSRLYWCTLCVCVWLGPGQETIGAIETLTLVLPASPSLALSLSFYLLFSSSISAWLMKKRKLLTSFEQQIHIYTSLSEPNSSELLAITCITNAIAWAKAITSSTSAITSISKVSHNNWHHCSLVIAGDTTNRKGKKLSLRKGMARSCLLLSLFLPLSVSFSFLWPFFLSPFAIMQLVAQLTSLSFSLSPSATCFFAISFLPLSSVCGFQGDSQTGERERERQSMFSKRKRREREEQKKWIEGRDHEWPTMCLKILAYIHTATCSGPGILILSEGECNNSTPMRVRERKERESANCWLLEMPKIIPRTTLKRERKRESLLDASKQ